MYLLLNEHLGKHSIQFVYHGIVNYFMFLLSSVKCYMVHFLSTASTAEVTSPSQTVGAVTTIGTLPVRKSTRPTESDEAMTATATIHSNIQPTKTVEPTSPPQTVGTTSFPQTVRVIATTGTVPVTSSTQPTNNPPSDGATTTSVIIVVAVVIILVVIVVGVVILVVLFRTKKRKQQLEVNKIQSVTTEKIELKLKQVENTEREANSRPDRLLYHMAVKQKGVLPSVHSKSEDVKYLNQNCTLSEYKLIPAESEYALPTKPPIIANLSNSMLESNPMYQSMDQCHYLPSTTIVPQNNDVYTVPKTASSHTNEADSVDHPLYEVSNLLYQSIERHHDSPSATNVPQGNNFYTVPNTTSSHTNEADSVDQPLYEVSNLLYQSMDRHHNPPSAANVPKGNDIYTEPDTTASHTVKTQSGPYETMPIQPSLFTDTAGNPNESENLPPHNDPSKEQACWAHNSEQPGSNI